MSHSNCTLQKSSVQEYTHVRSVLIFNMNMYSNVIYKIYTYTVYNIHLLCPAHITSVCLYVYTYVCVLCVRIHACVCVFVCGGVHACLQGAGDCLHCHTLPRPTVSIHKEGWVDRTARLHRERRGGEGRGGEGREVEGMGEEGRKER